MLRALVVSIALFLASVASALAADLPPIVEEFKTEFSAAFVRRDMDPSRCVFTIVDGSDDKGYMIHVKCPGTKNECLFHAIPGGAAVVKCVPNADYVPESKI